MACVVFPNVVAQLQCTDGPLDKHFQQWLVDNALVRPERFDVLFRQVDKSVSDHVKEASVGRQVAVQADGGGGVTRLLERLEPWRRRLQHDLTSS